MMQGRFSEAITGATFGLSAGICFAAAEVFWIGIVSHIPPLLFLLYMFLGDVMLFLLIGAIPGATLRIETSKEVSTAFFILIVIFVYVSNSIYRGSLPGLDGDTMRKVLAFLLLLGFSLPAAIYAHRRKILPVRHPFDMSFMLPVLVVSLGMLGMLVINKLFLPDFLTPVSLLSNLAFGICFTAALLLSLLLIRRQRLQLPGSVVATVFVVIAFLTAFLSPVQKLADTPEIRDNRPGTAHANSFPVALIVIDTLRADHVSIYGYHRKTTPHLDELAKDSVVFTHAISPSPWTLPAHASLFTGMIPSAHGSDFISYEREGINRDTTDRVTYGMPAVPLEESETTLAEVLAEKGYFCGAIIANFAYLWRGFQLDQGFAFYDDARGVYIPLRPIFDMRRSTSLRDRYRHLLLNYADAANVTSRCIKWLNQTDKRAFFLFVNYMDMHTPYAPPPKYRNSFTSSGAASAPLIREVEKGVMEGRRHLPEAMRQRLIDLYDSELMYVDAEIGRLLKWMKRNKLYDSSLIIVTSDDKGNAEMGTSPKRKETGAAR